ncbi:MFS general substrate transporter [Piromyces finnis]|uniref:MFS general substrate transporter n=1 Tax=Piromyces finnis TaxID=1754191 RepID=A0A1Y1UW82_9FUNG|nr:MFS general substrate transporter [Piromyces finnis]|eukprot:ORX42209.1 MFS general substrate transporter [Piromyces finnis]
MEKGDNIIVHEGIKVSDRKRLLMFININISCIASNMLSTALTTALPPIMKDFKIDASTGQWITSGFSLFLAIVIPFTAYLITKFKTKKLYCSAIIFFMIGLIICALAPGFWVMMIGRIIQGCGSGLITSMAQVIILTIYPPEKRGTAMGWYGMSIGVAPIIAPTLAGLLVDHIGWRIIFFDVTSLIISTFAFGGVTLAIGNIGKYKFISVHVLLTLLVGIIFSFIFIIRQLHLTVPFLDVRVFKNVKLSISIFTTSILQLLIIGSTIIFPIYVQQLKGKSATTSGLVIFPGSLLMAILCPLAGKVYDKIGMNLLFISSSIISIFSNLSLYFVNINTSIWVISSIHVLRCFAFGILLMPIITWGMVDVPNTKASDATAFFNSLRYIGGAMGSALFVSIMTIVADNVKTKKDNPEMYGFNIVFLFMTGFSVILLLLGIFSYKIESKKEENTANKIKSETLNEKISMKEDQQEIDIVVERKKINKKLEIQ